VQQSVTPLFNPIAPLCSGAAATPLPNTSTNGVNGTWSPAVVSNTTTTTYTFTPTGGGCATTASLTVEITPQVTPVFDTPAPVCFGTTAPVLSTTSNNGIVGTWTGPVSNTATGTYTFTPNGGQCASSSVLTVTVLPEVIVDGIFHD
jgi:hypothetical protein